ncbi:MAG: diguanylate cyclase [Sedimenticola sp.]|nr:diguanylate cyclase [Sedimenticola sp.]
MDTETSITIHPAWSRLFIGCRKNLSVSLLAILFCSLLYYLLGLLSLQYSFVIPGVPIIWLPSGLALFAVLLGGYRMVLVPFLGMSLLVIQKQFPLAMAVGAVVGVTLEVLLPVFFLRVLRFDMKLERIRDVMLFVGLGGVFGPLIPASLAMVGFTEKLGHEVYSVVDAWLTWWLAGSVGCLVLAGFLFVWVTSDKEALTSKCRVFLFSLLSGVAGVSMLSLLGSASGQPSLALFLLVPLIVFAATYCGRQGSSLLSIGATLALLVTMQAVHPDVRAFSSVSVVTLNLALIWMASFTGLVVASAYSERGVGALYAYQAQHDGLTQLLNRTTLERRLERAISSAKLTGRRQVHALMFIDLDDFKLINDQFGHATGDLVLCRLAELLQSQVRSRDAVARLGGDEFVVLLENCSAECSRQMAERIAAKVRGMLIPVGENNCQITASIGVVPVGVDTANLDALLSAADAAHYRAKGGGKNQVHFCCSEQLTDEC